MLTQTATYRIDNEGSGRDICVTPLFLQNHKEPWQPNEIFDLAQCATLKDGKWETLPDEINLGKIIVNDQREWRFEGDSDLDDDDQQRIATFVLESV